MTPSAPPVRRVAAAAALASGVLLLAACSSSASSGANPPATKTVTATVTVAPPTPNGGSSTPAAPACTTSELKLGLGPGNGAAGSNYLPILFTNQSSAACTLFGYPGVSFVSGVGGTQIGASAAENPASPRTLITLAPGDVAHALLQVVVAQNFPPAKCKLVTAHFLKVFPPGQTVAQYLKYTSPTCSNPSVSVRVLGVQSVQSGNGSS
jgi:hypothetical protein